MSEPSTSPSPSPSSSATAELQVPGNLKVVGVLLAIVSGVLIGTSFVFKKKGLLRSQEGGVPGEGVAYLKSWLWWTGMIMMIMGEICNFAAYAFVEAIVVTPMGALSVVICAILSSWFLKETLTFFGWLGCGLCIVGSVIIALNGPKEQAIGQITVFQRLFLSPGFLVFGSVLIVAAGIIIIYFAPRYGKQNMLWYILVCSMIGGLSVSVITGLGSAIVTSIRGDNQFKHWFIYFLLVFICITLLVEIYYLNVALALFNTAMVTPTYYVIFTFFTIITTIVLFKGLSAPPQQIITLVMGFLVICFGITVLQLSKVDPTQINTLDRRSTILLQAARRNTEGVDEKSVTALEDPGIDALRGSFATIGSIVRARSARRLSTSTRQSTLRARHGYPAPTSHEAAESQTPQTHMKMDFIPGLSRHQLYDPPMPERGDTVDRGSSPSIASPRSGRVKTIKFGDKDLVHSYHLPGTGDDSATHESRPSYIPTGTKDVETDRRLPDLPPRLELPEDSEAFLHPFHSSTPTTTTRTTFPAFFSAGSTTSFAGSEGDSLRAVVGISASPERVPLQVQHERGHSSPSVTPLHQPMPRQASPSSPRHLFGSRVRDYPKGDEEDDKEESVGLFSRDAGIDDDSPVLGLELESKDQHESPEFEEEGVSKHSIRLVTSQGHHRT